MDDILKNAPSYTCHKRVRALEIDRVGHYTIPDREPIPSGIQGEMVRPVGCVGISDWIYLPADMYTRYVPVPGDFLVIYEDGYQSFSPRKAFLDGYTPDGQSFAEIKQDLKK